MVTEKLPEEANRKSPMAN